MGPLDLQDLAASRLQICMRDAVVLIVRKGDARVLSHPWFCSMSIVLCEILILGKHIVKICKRATVFCPNQEIKLYAAKLYFNKKRNLSRGDFKILKGIGRLIFVLL
jgi:hypothetical protein